jgi:hypothetical protein
MAGNVTRLDDVIIHDRYSSGAIRLSGSPCLASCQFSSNSDLCRFVFKHELQPITMPRNRDSSGISS